MNTTLNERQFAEYEKRLNEIEFKFTDIDGAIGWWHRYVMNILTENNIPFSDMGEGLIVVKAQPFMKWIDDVNIVKPRDFYHNLELFEEMWYEKKKALRTEIVLRDRTIAINRLFGDD